MIIILPYISSAWEKEEQLTIQVASKEFEFIASMYGKRAKELIYLGYPYTSRITVNDVLGLLSYANPKYAFTLTEALRAKGVPKDLLRRNYILDAVKIIITHGRPIREGGIRPLDKEALDKLVDRLKIVKKVIRDKYKGSKKAGGLILIACRSNEFLKYLLDKEVLDVYRFAIGRKTDLKVNSDFGLYILATIFEADLISEYISKGGYEEIRAIVNNLCIYKPGGIGYSSDDIECGILDLVNEVKKEFRAMTGRSSIYDIILDAIERASKNTR